MDNFTAVTSIKYFDESLIHNLLKNSWNILGNILIKRIAYETQ